RLFSHTLQSCIGVCRVSTNLENLKFQVIRIILKGQGNIKQTIKKVPSK
ncbi:unnamed protein product, partial [Ixodes persulcatus]